MTAQTPSTTNSSSRRALLAGALGGLGAWAASAIGRASPVRAEGEAIVVGGEYLTATSRTYLANVANSETVIEARSTGTGTGVKGNSQAGSGVEGVSSGSIGVYGHSDSWAGVYGRSFTGPGVRGQSDSEYGIDGRSGSVAVYGESIGSVGVYGSSYATDAPAVLGWTSAGQTGVQGYSGNAPLPDAKPKTGVYGSANQDANAKGVWGFSGRGAGVYGQANKAGIALRANGRIKADKVSGVATIAAGSTSVTVNPGVNVTGNSFVLLTPKVNLGGRDLWFSTNATADTITIRLSSSRSSNTKIAWLLLG